MDHYRVAVVGSGPAGLYAADALVRSASMIKVDVLDRLPTPYGLVRYGVAPDHPRIKAIITALQRVLEHDGVRFLGDVAVGRDVTAAELDERYDAVVYATGAARDRRLAVAGEDLLGSVSATEFVAWYGGHPDSVDIFPLATESVVVIGAGNVALDVARVLAKSAASLSETDMPPQVLDRLGASRVRDVHLVCRRGPEHVKFTTKELRELGELDSVDVVLDPGQLPGEPFVTPVAAANVAALRALAEREVANPERRIHLHFWRRPAEILGDVSVEGVRLEEIVPGNGVAVASGRSEVIEAGMVVRSVGYFSSPVDELPFDAELGRIPHLEGRVVDSDGRHVARRYVAGWVKRGPNGVVGTNRACASDTVAALVADLDGAGPRARFAGSIDDLLTSRGVRPVTYEGWLNIDAGERERGSDLGRLRTKIPDWPTLRRLGVPV